MLIIGSVVAGFLASAFWPEQLGPGDYGRSTADEVLRSKNLSRRASYSDDLSAVRATLETAPPTARPEPTPTPWPEVAVTHVPAVNRPAPEPMPLDGAEIFGPGGQDAFADTSTITWLPPPASLHEMIESSGAIVIGTVTAFLGDLIEGQYSEDEVLQPAPSDPARESSASGPMRLGVPSSYFEVEIKRILLNDGKLEEGGAFILRLFGLATDSSSAPWPMPQAGDRFLFTLGINPDGASYGSHGPWGMIDISGTQPTYFDWNRTPIAFADDMSPEDFIEAVERVIREIALDR